MKIEKLEFQRGQTRGERRQYGKVYYLGGIVYKIGRSGWIRSASSKNINQKQEYKKMFHPNSVVILRHSKSL